MSKIARRIAQLGSAAVLVAAGLLLGGSVGGQTRSFDCCGFPDQGLRHHLHTDRAAPVPTTGGQETLMAIQQVTSLLLSDAGTDWSTVNIARLREWLVDWNRVALEARVEERPVDGGVEAVVTGDEVTMASLRRVVPGHLARLESFRDWRLASTDEGESLTVTLRSDDPQEVEVIRALGFFGVMSSGVYRPYELLAVARGVAE